ncbi:hypothetical protein LAJ19_03910 [Deinococcus taeanensis]|uniref:hypothetical protein n=1 Tax=Deinococcus taeanensis TaxID=2737050 RepID=UPI001CDC5135|nr:hypothetical protein [Deinococcus taeanensis]UBV43369.1 hypothetical protein LAJ19_03910 [Deinococcus taeanensis]
MTRRFMSLLRALPVLLVAQVQAAGILGTSVTPAQIQASTFCQQYSCGEPFVRGRDWQYPFSRYQGLTITRESGEAGSRVVSVSLWVRNDGLNAAADRAAFQQAQRLALGYVPYTGAVEPCYAAMTTRTLVNRPDERTLGVSCELWDSSTDFYVTADPAYLARTAPAPAALSSGPTKLHRWSFTTCASQSGTNTYLLMGEAARCTLRIETKGEQSPVVKAELQYEIEYVQNGQYVKKLLPGKELWLPGRAPGALDPRLTQQGRVITLNVSLAVKKTPGRTVTSLNTIAKLTFANGAVKTAYEPLLVR